ncbi:MAG: cell division protein FtsW [Candidatus Aminicenantes bacterium]|nr:cell division protein FtsW [Candidatus Aminicenantes bacterium]
MFLAGRFDRPLFIALLALTGFGLVMVYSTSGVPAAEKFNDSFHYLAGQAVGAAAGLAALFFFISFRRPFYQGAAFVHGLFALSVVLLALCFVMPEHAHTNRWIEFGVLRFQPSELAKISLVLLLAFWLERRKERRDVKTFLLLLPAVVLVMILILLEPDYGTALFIFFLAMAVFFLGGVKLRAFGLIVVPAALLFAAFLVRAEYRLDRLEALLYPERDPLGKSFQVIQSKMALGSGGVLGVSPGESVQKLYFLPSAHTDFIFAIIGEELGLVGTIGTLLTFLLLLWRGLRIARRAPDLFCQLAAAGITISLTAQALLNMTIVLGLGPTKGLPLPFISFGRSSLVCSLLAGGILLHISERRAAAGGRS